MSAAVIRVARRPRSVTDALGPGTRYVIWVQGCPLACPGCMSQDTWDDAGGTEMAVGELLDLWRSHVAGGADGLTLSGGEPLATPEATACLLREVHRSRVELTGPGGVAEGRELDIMLYTGHEPAELNPEQLEVVRLADVVVTGRFRVELPTDLIWRGSANQEMTPVTELGARRYGPYLDHRPGRPVLQLEADNEGILLIGVPRIGDLLLMEKGIRSAGMTPANTTWRRVRPTSTPRN